MTVRLPFQNEDGAAEPSCRHMWRALSLFVEGCRKDDVSRQLFGLSILRSATEAQVRAAMPSVQASQQVTLAEIAAMFAR